MGIYIGQSIAKEKGLESQKIHSIKIIALPIKTLPIKPEERN